MSEVIRLGVGLSKVTSTSFASMVVRRSWGGSAGPEVTNCSPLLVVPVTAFVALFQLTAWTLPSSTCWTNEENGIGSPCLDDRERALTTVRPTTATRIQTSQDGIPPLLLAFGVESVGSPDMAPA